MRRSLLFLAALLLTGSLFAQTPYVVINELNADNPGTGGGPGGGTDANEFIELYGDANASLDGLVLVFFNGNAAGASYLAYDLDGFSLDAQGFFLLGSATVVGADAVFTGASNNIQNGADAVGLFQDDAANFPTGTVASTLNLIDAVVYGTNDAQDNNLITLLGLDVASPGYVQLDETAQTTGTDLTISRIPDGGAAFSQAYTTQALTPGTWNQPPCTAGTITLITGESAVSFCDNESAVVEWTSFNGTGSSMTVITNLSGNIAYTTSNTTFDFTALVGEYMVYHVAYTGMLVGGTFDIGMPISGILSDECVSVVSQGLAVTINPCSGCVAFDIALANGATSANVILGDGAVNFSLNNNSTSATATVGYVLVGMDSTFIQTIPVDFDYSTLAEGSYLVIGVSAQGTVTLPGVGESFLNASATECIVFSTNAIEVQAFFIADVLINEVNADNPGGGGGGQDNAEFIELYGESNGNLNGLTLVLYNGNGGAPISYAAYDLDGFSTDALGFFVLGSTTVTNVDMVFPNATNNIQNGADAVALYVGNATDFPTGTAPTTAGLVDALVYGTADAQDDVLIAALGLDVAMPGYFQADETAQFAGTDLTLSRIPDGGLAFDTTYIAQPLTPGTWNLPPCGASFILFADSTTSFTICDSEVGTIAWHTEGGSGSQEYFVTDAAGLIIYSSADTTYDFTGMAGTFMIYPFGYTNAIDGNTWTAGLPVGGVLADECYDLGSPLTLTITPCSGCNGGSIATSTGATVVSVMSNTVADVLNLTSTSTSLTDTYTYVLTNDAGLVIQEITADFDFNSLAVGVYQVYGISYEGVANLPATGASVFDATATTCLAFSSNFITLNVVIVADIVFNELNADNPGGPDSQEFVEFYGEANANLDGLVVVLFDGQAGTSYGAYSLNGQVTDANGFFVMGNAAALNVDMVIPDASIQNGGDAIALYIGADTDFPNGTAPTTNNLVDAFVYGTGDTPATNLVTGLGLDVMFPGYTPFDETVQQAGIDLTQSRVPDGGAPLNNNTVVLQELTPGTFNIVILGCTDAAACNYIAEATVNDNSCSFVGDPCDDGNPLTGPDMITADCACLGAELLAGCTTPTACNYNPLALVDDGSCYSVGDACDDGDPLTLNDAYDANCNCIGIVGIEENELALNFTLYPNPVQNELNINVQSAQNGMSQVRVLDAIGQVIYSQSVVITNQSLITIDTQNWVNGVYSLEIRLNETAQHGLFIKQ